MTANPHPAMVLPFVLMLLSIALAPIFLQRHWERNYHKISIGLGAIAVFYYAFVLKNWERIGHTAHEYASFIVLIGSLFVVAGGIHIGVKGEAKPWVNCLFLLIGAILANVIGTTGASMLLIRPWIRMNKYRFAKMHTVFFIFLVSNLGGCLTPVGDPPLFLGYLKGIPFWWVFEHCWKAWCVAVFGMLAIFNCFDRLNFSRAPQTVREKETRCETWRFSGLRNAVFLAIILAAVFIKNPAGLREIVMAASAAASYFTTRKETHEANDFSFAPIREVAWLFIGIFATMMPALDFLELHAAQLGVRSELQFYWLTGALSSVLDNAPTYLAFVATAFGIAELNIDIPAHMSAFIAQHNSLLVAISLGAVFFGAGTYVGNGPNLMVKSIAEQAGVKTPSFIGYVVKFSAPILLPFFWIISLLFFSKWRVF